MLARAWSFMLFPEALEGFSPAHEFTPGPDLVRTSMQILGPPYNPGGGGLDALNGVSMSVKQGWDHQRDLVLQEVSRWSDGLAGVTYRRGRLALDTTPLSVRVPLSCSV